MWGEFCVLLLGFLGGDSVHGVAEAVEGGMVIISSGKLDRPWASRFLSGGWLARYLFRVHCHTPCLRWML